jgi:hypothetical protein
MAIQFHCPLCSQPIEVDDEWAAKPVACPYCSQTVTAPESSTIDVGAPPPVASPAGAVQGQTEVEPRRVYGPATSPSAFAQAVQPSQHSNAYAPWALGLSCTALVILILVQSLLGSQIAQRVGPSPTPDELEQAMLDLQRDMMDQIAAGEIPTWGSAMILGSLLVLVLWVVGLVLAIVAICKPTRRRMAIAALIACGLTPVMFCVGPVWTV